MAETGAISVEAIWAGVISGAATLAEAIVPHSCRLAETLVAATGDTILRIAAERRIAIVPPPTDSGE